MLKMIRNMLLLKSGFHIIVPIVRIALNKASDLTDPSDLIETCTNNSINGEDQDRLDRALIYRSDPLAITTQRSTIANEYELLFTLSNFATFILFKLLITEIFRMLNHPNQYFNYITVIIRPCVIIRNCIECSRITRNSFRMRTTTKKGIIALFHHFIDTSDILFSTDIR